jgi:hypothetical protein
MKYIYNVVVNTGKLQQRQENFNNGLRVATTNLGYLISILIGYEDSQTSYVIGYINTSSSEPHDE